MQKKKKFIIIGVAVVIVVVLALSSAAIVSSGSVGVLRTFGAINDKPMYEGFHLFAPFINSVTIVDTKTQKVEADCAAASKDLQTITSKIALNYHVDPASAPVLFKRVGASYETVVIAPAIQESVKAIAAQYSAEEIITKRQEVSLKISDAIKNKITTYGLVVDILNIVNLEFSDAFNAAIEAKQTAQQEALKAQQDLQRIKVEAEQTVTKAQADADAQRAAADAQAYSIKVIQNQLAQSSEYIEYQKVQKWNGELPQVQGDANAIIDLRP